jgi:hypothetical protein
MPEKAWRAIEAVGAAGLSWMHLGQKRHRCHGRQELAHRDRLRRRATSSGFRGQADTRDAAKTQNRPSPYGKVRSMASLHRKAGYTRGLPWHHIELLRGQA